MSPAPWNPDPTSTTTRRRPKTTPTLVSLHFVRTALRRRLLVCVLSAALGLLAAGTFMLAFPPSHQAKAALILTHDPEVDTSHAMETDLSLLKTRTVAARDDRAPGVDGGSGGISQEREARGGQFRTADTHPHGAHRR